MKYLSASCVHASNNLCTELSSLYNKNAYPTRREEERARGREREREREREGGGGQLFRCSGHLRKCLSNWVLNRLQVAMPFNGYQRLYRLGVQMTH